ncbi:Mid1-interacting protein 1-B [Oryzias melastigma]|uniref:MID1 interacting protein 1 n=1 Tax=Oryzias melastigma TaxID=30732 RepID=A0A3B3CGB3_ORYME|nr:mid1-interacting protein 1-B [Oryzias melastigma]KAF6734948.1 Mid1-interacting protein 1-B [Oryzias melastigma]
MQVSESYQQKNSLFSAMSRFIGAVNNMDQTVMLPSLLRDFPQEGGGDLRATATGDGGGYLQPDMYGSYVLLKSIRHDIEWGGVRGGMEDARAVEGEEDDLQKALHFHLDGLHAVLSKLTHKANTLTSRYKEEIGCGN